MFRFVEIRDGKAIFTGGMFSEETPFSRDEIEAEILDMADRLEEVNPNAPYLPDLRSGFEEFRKAQKSFEALDSAAPAFSEATSPVGEKNAVYQFAGIGLSLKTYLFGGNESTVSDQPSDFERLLPGCSPDSIGAVRAAAKTARMVQELINKCENPSYDEKFRNLLVFQGIILEKQRWKANFAYYDGRTGTSQPPFCRTLPELRHCTADKKDFGEYDAAIAALEGADLSCAVMLGVSNSSPERAMSARPSIQFLRVATQMKGIAPHAEGVFCPAGARPNRTEKTYLTAAQIEERMAGLATGHPDRAVYETALKDVEDRDAGLQAPVHAPG